MLFYYISAKKGTTAFATCEIQNYASHFL